MMGIFTHVTSTASSANKFVYYHGLQERWNFILCWKHTTNFIWNKNKITTYFIFTQFFNDSFYFVVNISRKTRWNYWINAWWQVNEEQFAPHLPASRHLSKQFYNCLFLNKDWVFECSISCKMTTKLW